MSAIGMDSLTLLENEELRKKMERVSARSNELEEALRKVREDMDVILRELSRIKMLEMQAGRAFNSLVKKRASLEGTLTGAIHAFDELVQRTG